MSTDELEEAFLGQANVIKHALRAVRSEERQANAVAFRARRLLARQRARCINALRGHLSECGHVAAPGSLTHADVLTAHVEDPDSSLPRARG